jgi:hypothetical protein
MIRQTKNTYKTRNHYTSERNKVVDGAA